MELKISCSLGKVSNYSGIQLSKAVLSIIEYSKYDLPSSIPVMTYRLGFFVYLTTSCILYLLIVIFYFFGYKKFSFCKDKCFIIYNIFIFLFYFLLFNRRTGLLFLMAENVCTAAYPPPLGFRAWAFSGGLAAALCSTTYFFSFFFQNLTVLFLSKSNCPFLSKSQSVTPPSVFLPILD
jgi:hypothetical protein